MIPVTVTFEVAEEYFQKLAAGTAKLTGGVVRGENGEIIKHVLPIKEIQSTALGGASLPAIGIGVAIAAATITICYRIEKAKEEIIKNLKVIQRDINEIRDWQESGIYGGMLASIKCVNKEIPNTIGDENRKNSISQENSKLRSYIGTFKEYIGKELQNSDIWAPEWVANFHRILLLYICAVDARLKLELELGEYLNALNILDEGVADIKIFSDRFEQICQKDNEFMALGGLSRIQYGFASAVLTA